MRRSLYARVKNSPHPLARAARAIVRWFRHLTLPAPRVVVVPMWAAYRALRATYGQAVRLFVCEPLFKACCAQYGRRVRTGEYVHWVQGHGDLIVGDDVIVDGKCGFTFASMFLERPALVIGDGTVIGHLCGFTLARRIEIGRHCMIASGVWMFDFPGHPLDPAARQAGDPPRPEEVRPIRVEDHVWVGRRCTIFPGVTLGEACVVAAGSVVVSDVAPYTVVAGYPARKIATVPRPAPAT